MAPGSSPAASLPTTHQAATHQAATTRATTPEAATTPAAGSHAALRWRTGTPVVDRGGGEVQLGLDPRWSVVLTGLSPAEVGWLCDARVRRHHDLARSAHRRGVSAERRFQLEDLLVRCGCLVRVGPGSGRFPTRADDAAVLGALRPDDAGGATLSARGTRAVGLSGLGRIGAALAGHLATAGVGTLVLDDRSPVQVADLGAGGYEQDDVGHLRQRALAGRLRARHPRALVRGAEDDGAPPDVVVVVESHAADPAGYERLLGAGVAHLPVVVREADVTLGPFVLPGISACVGCAERYAADADERWPLVARSLRALRTAPQETTLSACAAALAAGQVLAHLDGSRPVTAGQVLEVALPEAVPRLRPVVPHPGCGCTRVPR
ncbi:ThiF family adenylyltransferase [Isoptericola cucumis]|uniref:Thiamin biosynthesis protein n=1 Tax=Isoptericola cucumis TaxID=1776856 RepID=A0ABQ2B5D0_9MICO|nr:ThiF family adenylyltransferase [Isoptericola cucumis]GGI08191.1 thiamin biosynthesis protein [Isoptericola cucumis]